MHITSKKVDYWNARHTSIKARKELEKQLFFPPQRFNFKLPKGFKSGIIFSRQETKQSRLNNVERSNMLWRPLHGGQHKVTDWNDTYILLAQHTLTDNP